MAKVDLSPEAVTRRLRRVEELRRLCLALGRAKPVEEHRGMRDGGAGGTHEEERPTSR